VLIWPWTSTGFRKTQAAKEWLGTCHRTKIQQMVAGAHGLRKVAQSLAFYDGCARSVGSGKRSMSSNAPAAAREGLDADAPFYPLF